MPTLKLAIYTVHQAYHTSGGVIYKGFVESLWFAGAVLFHS